jgi:colicin import membrane protein
MPKLMQILEDGAEYILKITGRKRKRPNAPGTSKRKHFERANQKKRKQDFSWSPTERDSQKLQPKSQRSEVGCQVQESPNRDIPETHVEPPSQPLEPEEPLLSPRERKEQKKRSHQAKLEEQRRRNEEIRREEEASQKKREEEADERRRLRGIKEAEETRIRTARREEDERWEKEWSQRTVELESRLQRATWNWRGKTLNRHSPEIARREAQEQRLNIEELEFQLRRLKQEKQEERRIRDAARAKEDAERKKR